MPPVRAPSGGNVFSDISKIGGDFIAGVVEREKEREEKARQAALAADRERRTDILASTQQAQQARFESLAEQSELDRQADIQESADKRDRLQERELQAREDRRATAQGVVDSMELTPERSTALVEFFVENERFPPGMDITPPIDRQAGQQADQLEQLGFKADIKRRFLIMLAGDDVLDLTGMDFIEMADSEIKRMVSANPGADFELIQSTVIEELERTLKSLEQKKKASEQQGNIDFPVQFNREEQVLNQFTGNR